MKTIEATLLTHLALDATTWCYIARIETKDGVVMGFTTLDADVVYDDGAGSVTYSAENGFEPMRYQASADMSVDNTDMQGWTQDSGITEAQIRAGLFDFARVTVYRVNYMDLTSGRHEVIAYGTAGETTFSANSWRTEFRSLTQQLKQPINKMFSRFCRERFGSKPIGTGGEQPESRTPCGKDWSWTNGTITAVPDARFSFTDSAAVEVTGYYVDGVIELTSGDNNGYQVEVRSFASGVFVLTQATLYPMNIGDTYRRRKDCSKVWDDADNGCLFHWASERADHFRGEPKIPVSDGGSNMAPGAQINRA